MSVTKNDIKYFESLKLKKYRGSERKFLIEGFHLIEECMSSSYKLESIILKENLNPDKFKNTIAKARSMRLKIETVPAGIFSKFSETENSQGIVGVVNMPGIETGNEPPGNNVIALDRISDPGNLGTIIRTAYWFGIDSVILSGGSADIYNSKVLRSSQGAVFHMNITCEVNLKQRLSLLHSNGYRIYLLIASGRNELAKSGFKGKSVFVFGNEAEGISPQILDDKYEQLKIKGFSNCESLNVAISAGILMYHLKNGPKIV